MIGTMKNGKYWSNGDVAYVDTQATMLTKMHASATHIRAERDSNT